MRVLRNEPSVLPASLEIWEDSPGWELAYKDWLSGKSPTSDPRWKTGTFMCLIDRPITTHTCVGYKVTNDEFRITDESGRQTRIFSGLIANESELLVQLWVDKSFKYVNDKPIRL
jgi:alpha-mannosidase